MARVYSRARGNGCEAGLRFLWTGRRSEGVARVVLAFVRLRALTFMTDVFLQREVQVWRKNNSVLTLV